MRAKQPIGKRGSLKWIQQAVEERWPSLERPILEATSGERLKWLSPLRGDEFSEYRDADFLRLLDLQRLEGDLAAFWPRHGPQWDGLAKVDDHKLVLVEAKAHVKEFCTSGTAAGEQSRAKIEASFEKLARALDASPKMSWGDTFYQLANRLAHLWFLRENGAPAYLALVGFTGDREMGGPQSAEAWHAAYEVATYAMGLPARHGLSKFIFHVNPQVPNV